MLNALLNVPSGSPLRILCLGAHSDDIEIGCGGTMLKLLEHYPLAEVRWVVFSASPRRADEARAGAGSFLKQAGSFTVDIQNFRDGFFPHDGVRIKEYFELIKNDGRPDLILTHYRSDRHQDHRTISDLTWNTFRNHLIWEYEIPKFDGDFGSPTLFVCLTDAHAAAKCAAIMDAFVSQTEKHWLTEELLRSVLRIRGMEAGGDTRYAEAFYTRKMTL